MVYINGHNYYQNPMHRIGTGSQRVFQENPAEKLLKTCFKVAAITFGVIIAMNLIISHTLLTLFLLGGSYLYRQYVYLPTNSFSPQPIINYVRNHVLFFKISNFFAPQRYPVRSSKRLVPIQLPQSQWKQTPPSAHSWPNTQPTQRQVVKNPANSGQSSVPVDHRNGYQKLET